MNELTLNFNKKLYSINAINKAINDFSKICKITINQKDNNYILVFSFNNKLTIKEVNQVKDEFSNFVLGYMKDE
jgi:hypothetical protein